VDYIGIAKIAKLYSETMPLEIRDNVLPKTHKE
jgi:hypothetical protein